MAVAYATRVDVNDGGWVNITSYTAKGRWSDDDGAIDKLEFWLDPACPNTVDIGSAIRFYVAGTVIFEGYVFKRDEHHKRIIKCVSELAKSNHVYADNLYDVQTIENIVKALLTAYFPAWNQANIQNTGVTLKQFKASKTVFECINELAQVMDWQFYIKPNPPNNDFYFEPKGFQVNGQNLVVGTNAMVEGKWKFDDTRMVNNATVTGASRIFKEDDAFVGAPPQIAFVLSRIPARNVKVWVGGVKQVGGIDNVEPNPDYTVDVQNKTINFVVGSTPGLGIAVDVNYEYGMPLKVQSEDAASVALYGTYEHQFEQPYLEKLGDVTQFITNYLNAYAYPFVSGKLITFENSYRTNEQITVVDGLWGINDQFIVKNVSMKFGGNRGGRIEVNVGTEEYKTYDWEKNLDKRIKDLEEKLTLESSLLNKLFNILEELEVEDTAFVADTRTVAGNCGIYDHPVYGIYGTSIYGSNFGAWGNVVTQGVDD